MFRSEKLIIDNELIIKVTALWFTIIIQNMPKLPMSTHHHLDEK